MSFDRGLKAMDDLELKKTVDSCIREICHYSQMQVFATSYYQKNYFQMLIDERITALMDTFKQYKKNDDDEVYSMQQQTAGGREYTLQDLAHYDGSDGRPAYVAVNGDVYDMSMIPGWAGGTHFGLTAGKDYTAVFTGCHQGAVEMLSNVPRIGVLRQ
jgi:predicted heme/steroid binding protein